MGRPIKVKLVGRTYRVKQVDPSVIPGNCGEADHPSVKKREIRIDKTLRGREMLETLIHEALHGCDYFKSSEQWVGQAALDISILLWKAGYRKAKK